MNCLPLLPFCLYLHQYQTSVFFTFFIKDGIAALIPRSSSKVRESRNPLSTTNMSLSLTKPLMILMLHFNMWFNIESSLFLAMYGPRIATNWPVVVTTTIGLTSGLDLWRLYDLVKLNIYIYVPSNTSISPSSSSLSNVFASGRVWSFIICPRVILSKPRYKGTNDRMNACLTVCTALHTLEMLILKRVESNLFDNAHFIFIRNNPTEVLGVREGVFLIFTNTNEQMSPNSSRRRPVRFLQSLSSIWSKSILFWWFIHISHICVSSCTIDLLFEKDFSNVNIIVKHSVLRWPFSIRWVGQLLVPAGINIFPSINAWNLALCAMTSSFAPDFFAHNTSCMAVWCTWYI